MTGAGLDHTDAQVREEKRSLTLRGAIFLGIGSMVGAGIFALFGEAGAITGTATRASCSVGGAVVPLQAILRAIEQAADEGGGAMTTEAAPVRRQADPQPQPRRRADPPGLHDRHADLVDRAVRRSTPAAGPLQVALFMSAVVAAVVAHKNGHPWDTLGQEIVKGISLAMSAILILLMVGALIGVWNMSGTIATVVYYGIKYINPTWFYLAAADPDRSDRNRHRQFVDNAATLGVAFVGIGNALGMSEAITAGAVISGAYFGDKMTPLSETTILTPQIVGSNVYAHIQQHVQGDHPGLPDLAGPLLPHRPQGPA